MGRTGEREPGKNATNNTWQEDSDYFPYKCHNCGETGHKVAQCGKGNGKGKGKTCVYGAEEGYSEDTGAEAAEDLGDLDFCAVEDERGGGGQYRATVCENPDRPPARTDRS